MNLEDIKPGQKFSYEGKEGVILRRNAVLPVAPLGEEWIEYTYGEYKSLTGPISLWLSADVLAVPDLPRGYQPEPRPVECECGSDSTPGLENAHSSWCPKAEAR